MVVAALLHDIGDELAPLNHSEYAATVLKPYVSEKTRWIVEKHGEFQMYYYAHHLGGNRNQREKYKGHKYYQDTLDFCEKWDQKSFDPNFKSLTLKSFEPLIQKIFSRKPYSNQVLHLPNELKNEKSPYLKQHENNPVDWLPWKKNTLDKAKKERKPIFLSVGYALSLIHI